MNPLRLLLVLATLQILVAGQCGGDFNRDATVNMLDLVYQLDSYGQCTVSPCITDLTFDNQVNTFDVDLLLRFWGVCPGFGGTTRPDATFPRSTTSTTTSTTTTTTTTRTTFLTASTAPPQTTVQRTTTKRTSGTTPTTRPADAITLSFDPPLAPSGDCNTVQPGAVMAYWVGPNRNIEGDCRGKPSFLVRPTVETGYCFQFEYTDFNVGETVDLMFLSCAVGRDAICAWNAVYQPGFSLNDNGILYGCTTGSSLGAPTATWNGTTLPDIQPIRPAIERNEMHHLNLVNAQDAPFTVGDCLIPTAYPASSNVPARSYMVFCRFEDLPAEWRDGSVPTAGPSYKWN